MLIPIGLRLISELDEEFSSTVRTNLDSQRLIDKAMAAEPLRSTWAGQRTNSVETSVRQFALRKELEVGLSSIQLENYLFNNLKLLRLYKDGRQRNIHGDAILPSIDFYETTKLGTMQPSYLREALQSWGRKRTKLFTFFRSDWTVRSNDDFQLSTDSVQDNALARASESLADWEGASLCVLNDRNLASAFAFAEVHNSKISKQMLREHLGMKNNSATFEAIWMHLRASTPKTQSRGRPRGSNKA
ncbi:MAG: hypothetical protein ACK4VZ_07480 [Paracoccaceae bacterium]